MDLHEIPSNNSLPRSNFPPLWLDGDGVLGLALVLLLGVLWGGLVLLGVGRVVVLSLLVVAVLVVLVVLVLIHFLPTRGMWTRRSVTDKGEWLLGTAGAERTRR